MSIKLDPATAEKIAAFGKRRRKLILLRGICTFVTITLLGFGLVGLIDYLVFMDDWVRYILSTVAYILLAIALYFTCLRQLTHKSTVQELAIMFEMAAPSMKEKLLSAVELSDYGKSNSYESNIFKDAIQKDVAAEVGMIELESVLPKKLIMKWTRAAVITFAVFAALLLIPNLKFGTLMLRAVVPTANVARVSNIEITLIEPGNTDSVVPEGDAVSIVIQISDPNINTAYLESELESGLKDTISMQKISENRFSTVINVGRDDIRFRIRAHTALTKFYTLRAVPRPQAIEFEKKYTFPKYSGLEPKTVTEKKGDVRILEGTTVDVAIKADQAVETAELRFENVGGKKWTVPLTVTDDNILKGQFKVKSNANYKVHIVSKESGFKNKFSPKYDVQSLADLLPSITMTLPKSDMSLPANEVIDIRGNADDDLGLKEIFLSYKHNSGTWQNSNIINTNLKTLPISYKWELTSIKAEPGDEITFRLGARDRKGNEGFSSSIRLNIVADGFDQNRMNDYLEFTKVQKALTQLSDATKMNIINAGKNIDSNPLKAKQKFIQLASEIDNSVAMAGDVLETIKRATAKVSTKTAQSDLVLVGRVISYIKNSMLSSSSQVLISAVNEADKKTYSESRRFLSKGHTTSEKLNKLFKVLVVGNGSEVIAADIYTILEEQKNLASEKFQQNVSKDQVIRRQQSLLKNVEKTSAFTAKLGATDRILKNHYKHVGEKLEWTRKKSEEIIQRGPNKANGYFTLEFFEDDAFRKKKHEIRVHKINEYWAQSPAHQMPNDYWSARWTGSFMANEKGKHTFLLHNDGGVRLWIDEKLLVNDWIPSKKRDNKVEMELEKGQTVRIRLDYREDTHDAVVRLQCKFPNNQTHDVRPSTYERFHFNEVEHRFNEVSRDMNHATRVSSEQSQKARAAIRSLLEEESETVKEAAKDLEELAKAEEKLDKAIQDKKPEETKKKLAKEVAEKSQKAEKSLENAIAQLEERAQLEEMKKEPDSQFVEDMAKTAQALENLKEDNQTNTEKASEKAEKLAEAIEDLEKGHELKEAQKDIEQMIANEQNDEDPRKKVTENPELFKKAEDAVKELKEELAKDKKDETSKQMAEDLQKALHDHETNQTRDEMRHREHADKANKDVSDKLEKMQEQIAKAEEKLEEKMQQAREAINEETPTVGEQLEKLAQEARENQQETAKAVEDSNQAKTEDVQQQAKEMQKKQEVLNDKLEEMRKALRRQANAQDTSTKEGLEKARDADDALAMIQQPPPKAEELLRKAANSDDKVEQQQALAETNEQQKKIADALEKLSDHFNKENEQELAESRQELRENGEEMAADSPLAEEYEKAEAIADNQQKSVDEQIADLEKALAKDEVMQKELAQIAEDTAQQAAQDLKEAARNEAQIDQKLDQQQQNEGAQKHEMKQQAPQQQQNAQKTEQAAQDLERSAKHQQRLENNPQTDQTNQLAEQAQEAAEKMQQAQENLEKGENFQAAQQSVEQAKQAAQQAAQQAEAMQEQSLQNAQAQANQSEQQKSSSQEAPSQEASKQMAQALDQLDKAKAAQQAAQEAMAQAQQAAQQAQQAAQQNAQNSQAQQAAHKAQQAAQQAQQAAQQAQQAPAQGESSPEQMMQQAQQASQQAQQAMQQAMQQAQNAQNSQNQAQQAAAQAQMGQAQAQQASAQAQQAAAQAQQAMQNAQQAMSQAQQSQSQAMAEARQPSPTPGQDPGSGESQAKNQIVKVDPEKLKQEEEWAKLPKRLARDLRNAKQENVPEQYQKMVNAYFKIIAEQSKNQEGK